MGDVVEMNVSTTVHIEPNAVLNGAKDLLGDVLVIGWGKDGAFYIASSDGGIGDLLLLVEFARRELLEQAMT